MKVSGYEIKVLGLNTEDPMKNFFALSGMVISAIVLMLFVGGSFVQAAEEAEDKGVITKDVAVDKGIETDKETMLKDADKMIKEGQDMVGKSIQTNDYRMKKNGMRMIRDGMIMKRKAQAMPGKGK